MIRNQLYSLSITIPQIRDNVIDQQLCYGIHTVREKDSQTQNAWKREMKPIHRQDQAQNIIVGGLYPTSGATKVSRKES